MLLFFFKVHFYFLNQSFLNFLQFFDHCIKDEIRCLVYYSGALPWRKEFLPVSFYKANAVSLNLSEVFLIQVFIESIYFKCFLQRDWSELQNDVQYIPDTWIWDKDLMCKN